MTNTAGPSTPVHADTLRTSVRHAVLSDTPWIISQLRKFSDHYGTKRPLFGEEDHAAAVVHDLINSHLMLVATKTIPNASVVPDEIYDVRLQELVGFITGHVVDHPYNPDTRLLSEAFWWVAKAHRDGRAGAMLFDRFIEWGKLNVDWISMSSLHEHPVSPRTFINRGFKPYEISYLMEVE